MLDASPEVDRKLKRRSLVNLSRMGHCAPAIMQTLLDVSKIEAEWLVKLTAGLPGGIGDTGGECGGVTAPLVILGLRHARDEEHRGLPVVVYKGHDLLERFKACQGATCCRYIRGQDRLPLQCVGVVRQAPSVCAKTLCSDSTGAIADEQRQAYGRLYAHWVERDFHCAHAELRRLAPTVPGTKELRDATSAFLGGTVFTGMTCSAFTAGVMALGLALGKVEDSRRRVLRMVGTMAVHGDAFADDLNAFSKIMNLGHRLSEWFTAEFGSTQCRTLTQSDFSKTEDVQRYIDGGGTSRCHAMAERVARQVEDMIRTTEP
jgi:C_GCAxxG_C_C family probable redox protein